MTRAVRPVLALLALLALGWGALQARAPGPLAQRAYEEARDGLLVELGGSTEGGSPLPPHEALVAVERAMRGSADPSFRAFCLAQVAGLYARFGDLHEAAEWAERAGAADPARRGDLADAYRREAAPKEHLLPRLRQDLAARRLSATVQAKGGWDGNVLQEAVHPLVHSDKEDWSATASAGLSGGRRIGSLEGNLGLRCSESLYARHEEFDLRLAGLDGSLSGVFSGRAGAPAWQLGLGADHVTSAGKDLLYDLRLAPGLSLPRPSWRTVFLLSGGATANRYYDPGARNQNGETWTLSGGATRLLGSRGGAANAALSATLDRPGVASSRYDEGRLSAGLVLPAGDAWSLRPGLRASRRLYRAPAAGQAGRREDRLAALDCALARRLNAVQVVELAASAAENRSNQPDNHYRRTTLDLSWTLQF